MWEAVKNNIDELLKSYPYIIHDIWEEQQKLNKYISLQSEARDPLKSTNIDGVPHDGSVSDQTYQQVEKIIDRYQAEIDESIKKINNLLDTKKWLDKALNQLSRGEYEKINLSFIRNDLFKSLITKLQEEMAISNNSFLPVISYALNKASAQNDVATTVGVVAG